MKMRGRLLITAGLLAVFSTAFAMTTKQVDACGFCMIGTHDEGFCATVQFEAYFCKYWIDQNGSGRCYNSGVCGY